MLIVFRYMYVNSSQIGINQVLWLGMRGGMLDENLGPNITNKSYDKINETS